MKAHKKQDDLSKQLAYEVRFKKLANAIHSAASTHDILIGVRDQILSVYRVEMATIFIVDPVKNQLASQVLLGGSFLKGIRVPITKESIAGFVACTRGVLMINDAYDDDELKALDQELHFDASWDKKAGCRTRQVMAVPILFRDQLKGVIQLINKLDHTDFNDNDLKHAADLAETLGIAFYNQRKATKKIPVQYDTLTDAGLLSAKDLERAFTFSEQKSIPVEATLMEQFKISRQDLGQSLATFYNVSHVDLNATDYDPAPLLRGINIDYFKKSLIVPLQLQKNTLILATNDPYDQEKIQEVMQVFRAGKVEVYLALQPDIEAYLEALKTRQLQVSAEAPGSYEAILDKIAPTPAQTIAEAPPPSEHQEMIEQRPVILLVRKIIEDAHAHEASDIHIEPYGEQQDAEVRFRIDGRCSNVLNIPATHIRPVIARFKVLADLDISERRKPQDGKIKFRTSKGQEIELRIATIPTADGNEDIVLRVLPDSEPMPLSDIMPTRIHQPFTDIIQNPYGLILVVGPTGSGKTTTLHSALKQINTPDKKIWTAEDPVEITQYRLRQVQVFPKIGFTFAAAMRAFLRADPDVIMVGEMRDEETARMGIEASLTGHLVLSTLHTNSAAETISRLIDMGIDPFNFADSLLGVLAQRLVRTLCSDCKEAYHPDEAEFKHLLMTYGVLFFDHLHTTYSKDLVFYRPKGCAKCNQSGYKGRIGLYELLINSPAIKELIVDRASLDLIKQEAINIGMTTLIQEGIQQIFAGRTDYSQVASVCGQ